MVLAWIAGFLIPIKAARIDVAGLSLYASYIVAAIVYLRYAREATIVFLTRFRGPLAVLALLALWAVARGAGVAQPLITFAKLTVAFATTVTFMALFRRAERALYLGLAAGVILSVVYMTYQWLSSVFFGFSLPFTSSGPLKIGLGLSRRYGLARVTGFTEEPSFIATMLVGSVLLIAAYARRSDSQRLFRLLAFVGAVGLTLCTSNNLFATALIVACSWVLVRRGRIGWVMVAYYVAALTVTPFVLNRDITYYSRFSPYSIFLQSSLLDQALGHGLGSYPAYFARENIQFEGMDVASLASVWGGFLFDGGVVFAALVVWWTARIVRHAPWPDGLALFAVLLMLSNYNSPWWPLVSFALAQCLVRARKDLPWTPISTSVATLPVYGGTEPRSSPSP